MFNMQNINEESKSLLKKNEEITVKLIPSSMGEPMYYYSMEDMHNHNKTQLSENIRCASEPDGINRVMRSESEVLKRS